MTTEYDLPPLPAHWEHGLIDFVRSWGRAAIEADRQRRGENQQPFGYFRALPFGWTDCAETDEGAIALYERPQVPGGPVGYASKQALDYNLKHEAPADIFPSRERLVAEFPDAIPIPLFAAPQPPEPLSSNPAGQCSNPETLSSKSAEPTDKDSLSVAEPVKSYLTVKYDDKGDCLYVYCDSNEPAEAEENEQGVLLRRAFSDGRLVGVTILNFMGRYAEPVKVPSAWSKGTRYKVEPHGDGYAIYRGRDQSHHGLNLAHLTECTEEFAKQIEAALNSSAHDTHPTP